METLPATTASDAFPLQAESPPTETPPPAPPDRGWGPVARTAFRFAFAYWFLYSFALFASFPVSLFSTVYNRLAAPDPANPPGWMEYVGYATKPLEWYGQGKQWYTGWACRTFLPVSLGVDATPPTDRSGSGDRQYAYCTAFADLTLAVVVGLNWTVASELWVRLLTRRRPSYDRLNAFFRLLVRFHLMYFMIVYGAMKIWCGQFPPIADGQLEVKYGDSSPMGLLWRFMQFSQPYTSTTGIIETTCGLLLVCRRTTLLGAMCSVGAMGQVFLLNMCYDVPVKLMSGHLLLMAVTLVVQDWRKLANFFILAKPVAAAPLPALFVRWKWCHRIGLVVRTLLYLTFIGFTLERDYKSARETGILTPPESRPFVGRWTGVEFERDGETVPVPEQPANPPPMQFGQSKWSGEPGMQAVIRVSIQPQFQSAAFVFADKTLVSYPFRTEADDTELVVSKPRDPEPVGRLRMSFPEPDRMVLEGPFGQQRVKMTLRRIVDGRKEYLLKTTGFRWIQEKPFNR